MCDRCGKLTKEKLYKCTGCSFALCPDCYVLLHPPSRKGHTPLPPDLAKDNEVTKLWCEKHNRMPLEYVCLDTMECICCGCLTKQEYRSSNIIPLENFVDYVDGKARRLDNEIEAIKNWREGNSDSSGSCNPTNVGMDMDFNALYDSIKKSKELVQENLESIHKKVDADLKKREEDFKRFIQLWNFVVGQGKSQGCLYPAKLCGAMAEVEKLHRTISLNDIPSIIEVSDGGTQSKIVDEIKSFGTIGNEVRVRKNPIPTCSYNWNRNVHNNFLASAAKYLNERPFKSIDYKCLCEEFPVLKDTEKWIESLPLMCCCDSCSFSNAIRMRGIYNVFYFT